MEHKELNSGTVNALKTVYEQVCKAHDGIADFRAKLLAFLPIASGTGIFLLLDKEIAAVDGRISPVALPHFVGIGIFSAIIAVGLFIYELVGIHRCQTLRQCGSAMEMKLLPRLPSGRFTPSPERYLLNVVSIPTASLVIYPTVIGAWSYVACMGAAGYRQGTHRALITSGLVVLGVAVLGGLVRRGQKKLLEISAHAVSDWQGTPLEGRPPLD
jgi:hypothetical protein